ncbi:hypothetical protein JCM15457_2514 [Liquorilactobacillus sucicola DSM 21376 = JCM 15457]|uniref:DUF1684 domain-containing protein n=1 Tax=Liquorilactobacillus sucicola DSM 21376 = JCM 15457 TaxID=1423806 RepID=A0A023D052_9LACO|nr:DUF1684 domain-containing protein [Liquorilactobacillus sucicola]KRN07368.1 hypothetical protein FD15_GL002315 [Liquorilactobacillus sucicola DSM 21376 = JCM 15457]GAJ27512.1 hypothetical protein JCM15457_2514 [Liquorilactobacillus sucicola DSM 21376 = JCM 15457]
MKGHDDGVVTYQNIQRMTEQQFDKEWLKWHAKREDKLMSKYGWLSLRSIDWLSDGQEVKIAGFPGKWKQQGNAVSYIPENGKAVTNRWKILTAPKTVVVDSVADVNVEDFDFQGVRAQLIKRIGSDRKFAVRQRDPHSSTKRNFTGLPYFEPDKNWVFPARYIPLKKWEILTTASVLGDLSHNETHIGDLYFSFHDEEYRLVVFQAHNDDSGWLKQDIDGENNIYLDNRQNTQGHGTILFRDLTTGAETYGGGRRIRINISKPQELDYIDFNTAVNLPCAFSSFCTCPFAPSENTLPFKVRVGETTPKVVTN